MQNVYAEIIIRNIDDLYEYLRKSDYARNGLTFRGQMDESWSISSGIERKMQPYFSDRYLIGNYEEKKIIDFQRRAHTFIPQSVPEQDDYLEWLALLQHHGAKTRLIDFSRSIFVACYFATRYDGKSGKDAAIWGIHLGKLERFKMRKVYSELGIQSGLSIYEKDQEIIQKIIKREARFVGVSILSPFRQNKRLFAQQGEFLSALDINKSFMDNLAEVFVGDCDTEVKNGYCDFGTPYKRGYIDEFSSDELVKYIGVVKFIIPEKVHKGLRIVLEHMNIQTASLFPDFEGAVMSLNHDYYE